MSGIPVVVSANGYPVIPVLANAPVMSLDTNGNGIPITPVDTGGTPFIVEGLELVTNGEFATDISGWTSSDAGAGATDAWDAGSGGRMALPRIDGSNLARSYQGITTVPGRLYRVAVVLSGSIAGTLRASTTTGLSGNLLTATILVGSNSFTFTATGATSYVSFNSGTNASTMYIDSVSVRQAA